MFDPDDGRYRAAETVSYVCVCVCINPTSNPLNNRLSPALCTASIGYYRDRTAVCFIIDLINRSRLQQQLIAKVSHENWWWDAGAPQHSVPVRLHSTHSTRFLYYY